MTTLALLVALAVLSWIVATIVISAAESARDAAERLLSAWEARRHG